MQTEITIQQGSALDLANISSGSVHLVVTSPPYPMIEMWDPIFAEMDQRITKSLKLGRGREAFAGMHALLDRAWREVDRVLKPGGIVCINIGDATRTVSNDFQLYSNHSRILHAFLEMGYAALPDILWRKQTNAPTKFMGSGMLPVGAYVTYEHEYILILRKEPRREFRTAGEKSLRRESAFFWEERNLWFSDVWQDIKGASQELADQKTRARSGAFPFELAYRLICMFSVKGDWVLDPFAGTGTTLIAALATARNGLGVEIDPHLAQLAGELLPAVPRFARAYTQRRLQRHTGFVHQRTREKGPLKHSNVHYGFPVMTAQERELLLSEPSGLKQEAQGRFQVSYASGPGAIEDQARGEPDPADYREEERQNPGLQARAVRRTKQVQQKLPIDKS